MAYQALYRKYRPTRFEDMVGQKNVVNILLNSLKTGKHSHAYLFSGPRGTGKTTAAKIFARSLNCTSLLDNGDSCLKCENCLSIMSNECTDIIEIDAASNNGVDEIREIKNKVSLVPSELKYKVYIIDEVHMLSIGAFNALLKTLEEPPAHVIFILATTDPQKVPITIISRCQCLEFKRVTESDIIKRLKEVCSFEKIEIEDKVLEKIAYISDGGMRDALGLLDKINSYSNGKVTLDDFNEINNLVGDDYKNQFILSVYNKNILEVLNQIEYLYSFGKDLIIFSQELMDILRKKMINYYVSNLEEYPIDFIVEFINIINKLLVNLKNSSSMRVMFETTILSYIGSDNVSTLEKNSSLGTNADFTQNKPVTLDSKQIKETQNINDDKNMESRDNTNIDKQIKQYLELRNVIVDNTFATAKKEYLNKLKTEFNKLNDFVFDTKLGATACYLIDTNLCAVGDNDLILSHKFDDNINKGVLNLENIIDLLEKCFSKRYNIAILTNKEWAAARDKFIDDKTKGIGYKYQKIDLLKLIKKDSKNNDNNDIINSDDIVKQAIDLFGADVVKIEE